MIKDFEYYMSLPYSEIIEADPAGGYVGHIAELAGCVTQGETRAEVLAMLDDAKAAWLETALEENLTIPEPLAEEGFSGKFLLRIPKSLHRRLALTARREGVSLNQLAACLLAGGLGAGAGKSV